MSTSDIYFLCVVVLCVLCGCLDLILKKWDCNKSLIQAHQIWLEFACEYAEWKSKNRYMSDEKHHQWFLGREISLYLRYLSNKKEVSPSEIKYRKYLESQVINIPAVIPPDVEDPEQKRR